ncbi:MAG: hypothetical protein M3044_04675 [Thermoproteota archaeon]|nr:hypothetical protein [Thermoproteota archaeon]
MSKMLIYTPILEYVMAHTHVDCRTTSIGLATLNLALSLASKSSLDESLNELEIAPDFKSIKGELLKLVQHIRDTCHDERAILQEVNFDQHGAPD